MQLNIIVLSGNITLLEIFDKYVCFINNLRNIKLDYQIHVHSCLTYFNESNSCLNANIVALAK